MLSELLEARVVIADLTGRNPNVFYELGITHSFARPLISIADSSSSLPFDAKDERVIELGEYSTIGLTYAQGETAKASLQESLRIVLSADYSPPSPLREVAANRSVDQLAPENPLAAEMAQMRENLEDIRSRISVGPRLVIPDAVKEEISMLRSIIFENAESIPLWEIELLVSEKSSAEHKAWLNRLLKKRRGTNMLGREPSANADEELIGRDPPQRALNEGGYSDEPPF